MNGDVEKPVCGGGANWGAGLMDVGGATRDNTTSMKRTVNNNDSN